MQMSHIREICIITEEPYFVPLNEICQLWPRQVSSKAFSWWKTLVCLELNSCHIQSGSGQLLTTEAIPIAMLSSICNASINPFNLNCQDFYHHFLSAFFIFFWVF